MTPNSAEILYGKLAERAHRIVESSAAEDDQVPFPGTRPWGDLPPASDLDSPVGYEGYHETVEAVLADPYWCHTAFAHELEQRSAELRELIAADVALDDPEWKIYEATEGIKDLFQIMLRRLEREVLDDGNKAVRFVIQELHGVAIDEACELLRIDEDQAARMERDDNEYPWEDRRASLIAQLVYDLRHSASSRGIVDWFDLHRDELQGRSPIEVIDALGPAGAGATLRELARASRGQVAT